MASRTLSDNNNDDKDPFKIRTTLTQDDDSTEMASSNRKKKEATEREIMVKWQMPGNLDSTSAKKQLIKLILELLMVYPDTITFIDSKHREWSFKESDDEGKFGKEFETTAVQVHPIKNKQQRILRWVAITKVRTSTDIQDWKNNDQFYSQATEAKTYLFPHPFEHDEWDITSIGFIKNIHAVHYPKEELHNNIDQMLKTQEKNPPPFQLIPQRITNKDKNASTRAYTVQCPKTAAKSLIHLLTHGPFRSTQLFIPFRYKIVQPELFTNCIRSQNEVYYKTWIIKLEGITSTALQFIENDIKNMSGVYHIVPTKKTRDVGEWKILLDQSKCAFIHRQLTMNWKTIVSKIPQEVIDAAPSTYSTPKISSKKVREYQENDSDIDSYGSLLTTGTDTSLMTNEDDSYNELPNEYQYPTYATAAAGSTRSVDDTQISSPTTSTYNDWQKERKELEAMIQAQATQIEQIQAELQSKVSRSQDLEDQLAQAIDLAHTRDARYEEILQKFEMLMNRNGGYGTISQDNPYNKGYSRILNEKDNPQYTPPRLQPTTESPPPKKANTNNSPQRHLYTLFRQPNTKMTRHYSQRQGGSGITSTNPTQPMEVEDSPQPPPVAKSGKKVE